MNHGLCVRCESLNILWVTLASKNILVKVNLTKQIDRSFVKILFRASYKKPVMITLQIIKWEPSGFLCDLINIQPPPPEPIPLKSKSFIKRLLDNN
jgi:hypothetical protein